MTLGKKRSSKQAPPPDARRSRIAVCTNRGPLILALWDYPVAQGLVTLLRRISGSVRTCSTAASNRSCHTLGIGLEPPGREGANILDASARFPVACRRVKFIACLAARVAPKIQTGHLSFRLRLPRAPPLPLPHTAGTETFSRREALCKFCRIPGMLLHEPPSGVSSPTSAQANSKQGRTGLDTSGGRKDSVASGARPVESGDPKRSRKRH